MAVAVSVLLQYSTLVALQLIAVPILCSGRAAGSNVTSPVPVGAAQLSPPHNFWVSPGGTFAFGFLEVNNVANSTSSSSMFSLSLFYTELQTVVWTANRGHLVSENARLELRDGNLVLTDGTQNQVWATGTFAGQGVVLANVSDEGRLLLLNSSGAPVWDSWLTPTDTLLPGQTLYSGMSLIGSKGLYTFIMQEDANLVMYDQTYFPYWATGTYNQNYTQLLFNSSGSLMLISNRSNVAPWEFPQTRSLAKHPGRLRRLAMGNDGLLVYYVVSDDSTTWNTALHIPADVCGVPQLCGPYGICTSTNDPSNSSYTCSCVDELVPVDSQNRAFGCHIPGQANVMDCDLGTKLIRLAGVTFFNFGPSKVSYQTSVDGCAQDCNSSCSCAGAMYEYGSQYCTWLRVGYLRSGNGNSGQTTVSFIKIAALHVNTTLAVDGLPASISSNSRSIAVSTPVAMSIGIATGMVVAGVVALLYWCRKGRLASQQKVDEEEDARILLASTGPVHFTYSQLRAATNSFSEVLGRGGFGPVYRGVLAGGMPVAVKVLEGSSFGEKQFSSEVKTIGSIHHVNLVRLRGYCMSGSHRLLVYDLMANGSLDQYLYSSSSLSHSLLDWNKRFEIVLGTARAIRYLHEECQPRIVHCDIKPQNILLDEDFHARISDFGLAQLVGGEFTGTITRVRGTAGYMAPEWMSSIRISTKLDVYSFGMVVLELLSGRKTIDTSVESDSKVELSSWAYAQLAEFDNPSSILDPLLLATDATIPESPEFTRSYMVAFWCIQKDPVLRPSMGVTVQMLEGLCPVEEPPCPF